MSWSRCRHHRLRRRRRYRRGRCRLQQPPVYLTLSSSSSTSRSSVDAFVADAPLLSLTLSPLSRYLSSLNKHNECSVDYTLFSRNIPGGWNRWSILWRDRHAPYRAYLLLLRCQLLAAPLIFSPVEWRQPEMRISRKGITMSSRVACLSPTVYSKCRKTLSFDLSCIFDLSNITFSVCLETLAKFSVAYNTQDIYTQRSLKPKY